MVTLSVFGYDVPVWSVTLLQGGLEIYSPLGVIQLLPVDPTPPWLKLFTQALDPWDNDEEGNDGVRREACWLERHMGDIVVEVC